MKDMHLKNQKVWVLSIPLTFHSCPLLQIPHVDIAELQTEEILNTASMKSQVIHEVQ